MSTWQLSFGGKAPILTTRATTTTTTTTNNNATKQMFCVSKLLVERKTIQFNKTLIIQQGL
jgi:hypothetical protein